MTGMQLLAANFGYGLLIVLTIWGITMVGILLLWSIPNIVNEAMKLESMTRIKLWITKRKQ